MLKKILLFIVVLFSISFQAQTKEELVQVTEKIVQKSIDKDYASVLDETYPAIFELFSKEQMMAAIEQTMNNPAFKMELLNIPSNIEISKIIEKEGNKYAVVSYDMGMIMEFSEGFSGDLNMMTEMMKAQSPTAEIAVDEEKKTIEMRNRSYSFAIADDLTKHQWKLINKEQNYAEFIEKYVPKEVREELSK